MSPSESIRTNTEEWTRSLERFVGSDTPVSFEKDDFGSESAFCLTFEYEGGVSVCVRILFEDQTGADITITNFVVSPETARSSGIGSKTMQKIRTWAEHEGFHHIVAGGVADYNESFWMKNGFSRRPESPDFEINIKKHD